MSEENKKRESAMRIFGALSAVDEEYLAACEKSGAEESAPSGIAVFMQRYGKAMAAVICLGVLGISFFAYQTGGPGGVRLEPMGNSASYVPAPPMDQAAEAPAEPTAKSAAAVCEEIAAENDSADLPGFSDVANGLAQDRGLEAAGSARDDYEGMNSHAESFKYKEYSEDTKVSGSVEDLAQKKEIALKEAGKFAVVGEYVPVKWPERGEITQVRGNDTEGSESVELTWSYGDSNGFVIEISNLGSSRPVNQEAAADKQVYEAADFTKECVKSELSSEAAGSGSMSAPAGSFTVLYRTKGGQYVSVSFRGTGSVDEVWALLQSIEGE